MVAIGKWIYVREAINFFPSTAKEIVVEQSLGIRLEVDGTNV